MKKCSVDLITGFLSSGKTSLINTILDSTKSKEEIIVIQCEKGLISIEIIENYKKKITIKELSSNEELTKERLLRMIKFYYPSRIIIECNGVGNTKKITEMLNSKEIKQYVKIGVIVSLVDCTTLNTFLKNIPSLILPNIQMSNIIILNKCSNVSNETIKNYISIIENLNLHAHILTCSEKNDLVKIIKNNTIVSKVLG